MTTFVLVHGAWHGGWCWAGTEKHLRALGHEVHTPTLTGLGERSHLAHPDIDPDLHVQDIVNTLKWRELSDVVLVGHSYGGLVVTGVASKVPERIGMLIYLDAFVPEVSQLSVFAQANPERMAGFQKQIDAGKTLLEPDMFDAWTDDPLLKDWLKAQCTPQPVECLRKGVTLTGREHEVSRKAFILAERNKPSAFWAEYERVRTRPDWHTSRMPNKHDVMVEDPKGLAQELVRLSTL